MDQSFPYLLLAFLNISAMLVIFLSSGPIPSRLLFSFSFLSFVSFSFILFLLSFNFVKASVIFLSSYDEEAKLSVGISGGGLFYFFTERDLLRLRFLLLAKIFLSKRFIELVKLFEALLLELLMLPEGFEVCLNWETFVLFAFLSLDDYVSES